MKKQTILLLILVISLLLTGCGTVNFYQKLYRDGTFDITVEVKSSEQMFLTTVEQGLEESGMLKGAIRTEQADGYKYFIEKTTLAELNQTNASDSFIGSSGFKREFKFPYYYYTITIINEQNTSEEDSAFTGGFGFNYILEPFGKITDTNGFYTSDEKKAVQFNLMKSKTYYVTFRDFFLYSWIGGATKILEQEATIPTEELLEEDSFVEDTEMFGDTVSADEDYSAFIDEEYYVEEEPQRTEYASCESLGCDENHIAVGDKSTNQWYYCDCFGVESIAREDRTCFSSIDVAEAVGYYKAWDCE
ncbi:hypothetical protein HZC31_00095 [Candidatus Woesearchaeota archaeon]|nr:hypothetical protein [Candidatus Woesearchaeota archaeon]